MLNSVPSNRCTLDGRLTFMYSFIHSINTNLLRMCHSTSVKKEGCKFLLKYLSLIPRERSHRWICGRTGSTACSMGGTVQRRQALTAGCFAPSTSVSDLSPTAYLGTAKISVYKSTAE